jgi:hypothetical protein
MPPQFIAADGTVRYDLLQAELGPATQDEVTSPPGTGAAAADERSASADQAAPAGAEAVVATQPAEVEEEEPDWDSLSVVNVPDPEEEARVDARRVAWQEAARITGNAKRKVRCEPVDMPFRGGDIESTSHRRRQRRKAVLGFWKHRVLTHSKALCFHVRGKVSATAFSRFVFVLV